MRISVRVRRIELRSRPWQGRVLPLNHVRSPRHDTMSLSHLQFPEHTASNIKPHHSEQRVAKSGKIPFPVVLSRIAFTIVHCRTGGYDLREGGTATVVSVAPVFYQHHIVPRSKYASKCATSVIRSDDACTLLCRTVRMCLDQESNPEFDVRSVA